MIDFVTAAKDVLNVKHLSKKSFVVHRTRIMNSSGSSFDVFYCIYSATYTADVVDYGTTTKPDG
jgi:hypothetical protein